MNDSSMEEGVYRQLSPDLFLAELALTADAILIDVRTVEEMTQAGLFPEASNLDFLASDFQQKLSRLNPYLPYFLFCDDGKRARMASVAMVEHGFWNVCCLEGGKAAWELTFNE